MHVSGIVFDMRFGRLGERGMVWQQLVPGGRGGLGVLCVRTHVSFCAAPGLLSMKKREPIIGNNWASIQ